MLTLIALLCSACPPDDKHDKREVKPLNISVFLDLSDRLLRDNVTPSQMSNDTTIINHLIDKFVDNCKQQKIIGSTDFFDVIFYPIPKDSNIVQLSRNLRVDMSELNPDEKKKRLLNMKGAISQTLDKIYSETLSEKNWVGSDIWDFFTNKEVDKFCIKKGYRNVVVILTDGYIYHANNLIQEGNAFSYILPRTLKEGGTLISGRNDLKDVEVLVLEVNPKDPKEWSKMEQVLKAWFTDMGLREDDISINKTSVPTQTFKVIDDFLNH